MIDFTQFDALQLLIVIFDIILVALFSFFYVKAIICIYEDLYKERVKKFFKGISLFGFMFFF